MKGYTERVMQWVSQCCRMYIVSQLIILRKWLEAVTPMIYLSSLLWDRWCFLHAQITQSATIRYYWYRPYALWIFLPTAEKVTKCMGQAVMDILSNICLGAKCVLVTHTGDSLDQSQGPSTSTEDGETNHKRPKLFSFDSFHELLQWVLSANYHLVTEKSWL